MKRLVLIAVATFSCQFNSADTSERPAKLPAAIESHQDMVYLAPTRPILLRLHLRVDGRPLATVWDEYITRVFQYADVNGDNVLDKTEIKHVPSAAVLFGDNYQDVTPTLRQLDANGDGEVTRDELAGYYCRLGATPFQVPGGNTRDRVDSLFQYLLLEQAAVVNRDEGETGNPDSLNEMLFKRLDTNGDGKLSKDELTAASAVLLKLDRNDDEIITQGEVLPGAGPMENERLTFIRAAISFYRQGGEDPGPFWLVRPIASPLQLARKLQQEYRKSKKAPLLKKLGQEEIGLDEAAFKRLDVDGDGFLDTEELSRFAQRPPDLELQVDLGRNASVRLVKQSRVLEANVHSSKEGMVLELGGTRLDLKALVTEKVDAAQARKQERDYYLKAFQEADRDQNGYVDLAEAMRNRLFGNMFKAMDRDGDGRLFWKEVLTHLDTFQGLQAAARQSCATVGLEMEGKGLFELLDSNNDGRLSIRELRNAVKLLADLDRDGDGALSRAELPRCSQVTFQMGPASGTNPPGHTPPAQVIDVRTGRIQEGVRQPPPPPRGPEWFRKMDRNGDGDVSRREFIGTEEQFRAIDTDSDGLISVEEAEAYDKKRREQRDGK
jgi:Ca2+-binding EF-hand superfamily protein